MAYIGQQPSNLIATAPTVSTYTADGGNSYALTRIIEGERAAALEVFVSNVQQQPDVSYTITGSTLVFATAPDTGEPIYVIYRDRATAPIGFLTDDLVTTSKILNGSVTNAKIADGTIEPVKLANLYTGNISDIGTIATQDSNNVSITGGTATLDSIIVTGNLTVNGTTTTINSSTVTVDDKNIELASTDTPSDLTADGGGITLKGDTDKTLLWSNTTGFWGVNTGFTLTGNLVFTGAANNIIDATFDCGTFT